MTMPFRPGDGIGELVARARAAIRRGRATARTLAGDIERNAQVRLPSLRELGERIGGLGESMGAMSAAAASELSTLEGRRRAAQTVMRGPTWDQQLSPGELAAELLMSLNPATTIPMGLRDIRTGVEQGDVKTGLLGGLSLLPGARGVARGALGFADEGKAARRAGQAYTYVPPSDAELDAILQSTMENGGASFLPSERRFLVPGQDKGVMVGGVVTPKQLPAGAADREALRHFIGMHRKQLEADPTLAIGTWRDKNGDIHFDLANRAQSDAHAAQLLLARPKEQAIFRLDDGSEAYRDEVISGWEQSLRDRGWTVLRQEETPSRAGGYTLYPPGLAMGELSNVEVRIFPRYGSTTIEGSVVDNRGRNRALDVVFTPSKRVDGALESVVNVDGETVTTRAPLGTARTRAIKRAVESAVGEVRGFPVTGWTGMRVTGTRGRPGYEGDDNAFVGAGFVEGSGRNSSEGARALGGAIKGAIAGRDESGEMDPWSALVGAAIGSTAPRAAGLSPALAARARRGVELVTGSPATGNIFDTRPETLMRDRAAVPQRELERPAPVMPHAIRRQLIEGARNYGDPGAHMIDDIEKIATPEALKFGATFYQMEPLRRAFIDEHGPEVGDQLFRRFAELVGATSPNADVPSNVARAAFLFPRAARLSGVPVEWERYFRGERKTGVNKLVPEGVGTLASGTQAALIKRVLENRGLVEGADGQKVASFTENTYGNWNPATIDRHANRTLTGDYSKDVKPPVGAQYGFAELGMRRFGDELVRRGMLELPDGFDPYAATQAVVWGGDAARTGVKSDARSMLEVFDNTITDIAARTNRTPVELLRSWIRAEGFPEVREFRARRGPPLMRR